MELLVVGTLIGLSYGDLIPAIPEDNSHYVEGVSRYFWMPDEEGVAHLVDVQEPVERSCFNPTNGANNEYWLYTRQNPDNAQIIIHGDANSVLASNYRPNRPLNVIVHGWTGDGTAEVNHLNTAAFLATQDCNVIVVDWKHVSKTLYHCSVRGVPSVGQYLGKFLIWLIDDLGGDWDNVHLVGFSLGAHVVGNAGRTVGGRASRVTGLDPAGPLWYSNENALNTQAAQYVEVIHTDGGVFGILAKIGHSDFFPNHGRWPQPGCWFKPGCAHKRAYQLFASTVYTNHLIGHECTSFSQAVLLQCNGKTVNMGNALFNKRGQGIYGLNTGSSWPF